MTWSKTVDRVSNAVHKSNLEAAETLFVGMEPNSRGCVLRIMCNRFGVSPYTDKPRRRRAPKGWKVLQGGKAAEGPQRGRRAPQGRPQSDTEA